MGFPAGNISKKTRETTNPQQVGQVLDQMPAVGTVVDPATEQVTLTVGVLPATVTIPPLICKTLEEAQAVLPNGVVIVSHPTATTPDPSCQPGEIVSQDPAAGTEVIPNTDAASITVTVNPSTVTIGDYTCMNFNKAKSVLNKLGLQANFGGTTTPLPQCPNPQFVAMQDPAPGSDVPINGSVTLFTGSESQSPSPTETQSP
jgi:beta-lactam-binding protein with PASTA domain